MPGSLIRSAILSGASELIRSHGQQATDIAQRADLPAEALRDPDLLVPAQSVLRFFELAADACEDRTWGLELAGDARLAAIIGPLWILLRNAPTVRQMCVDLAENFDLYSNAAIMDFWPSGGGDGVLSWSTAAGQAQSEVQMAEFALTTFCNEIRMHCRQGWVPKAVHFRHAAPANLRLHRKLFGTNLQFDQERNAIVLDAATLARQLRGGASHARALIRNVLRSDEVGGDADMPMRVESIVRSLLPFAPCTVTDVSRAMGTSTRTLQERLQRQGRSFKAIKDTVRADLALKYLQHSRLSVGQIAELLGYADTTSFSRSFRRWHGRTAQSVRRRDR